MRYIVVVFALLASCARFSVPYPHQTEMIHDVSQAKALWSAHSGRDYRYRFHAQSFACGTPPVVITVRNGTVASVVFDADHHGCQGKDRYRKGQDAMPVVPYVARSVDSMFALFDELNSVGRVEASFHPQYGFPTSYWFVSAIGEDDSSRGFIDCFEFMSE